MIDGGTCDVAYFKTMKTKPELSSQALTQPQSDPIVGSEIRPVVMFPNPRSRQLRPLRAKLNRLYQRVERLTELVELDAEWPANKSLLPTQGSIFPTLVEDLLSRIIDEISPQVDSCEFSAPRDGKTLKSMRL
jgi:hypothetical protein